MAREHHHQQLLPEYDLQQACDIFENFFQLHDIDFDLFNFVNRNPSAIGFLEFVNLINGVLELFVTPLNVQRLEESARELTFLFDAWDLGHYRVDINVLRDAHRAVNIHYLIRIFAELLDKRVLPIYQILYGNSIKEEKIDENGAPCKPNCGCRPVTYQMIENKDLDSIMASSCALCRDNLHSEVSNLIDSRFRDYQQAKARNVELKSKCLLAKKELKLLNDELALKLDQRENQYNRQLHNELARLEKSVITLRKTHHHFMMKPTVERARRVLLPLRDPQHPLHYVLRDVKLAIVGKSGHLEKIELMKKEMVEFAAAHRAAQDEIMQELERMDAQHQSQIEKLKQEEAKLDAELAKFNLPK